MFISAFELTIEQMSTNEEYVFFFGDYTFFSDLKFMTKICLVFIFYFSFN